MSQQPTEKWTKDMKRQFENKWFFFFFLDLLEFFWLQQNLHKIDHFTHF